MPHLTYLDHNATSPLDPRVLETISAAASEATGNPDSPHTAGRRSRARLEGARETVARLLGAAPREITFVSGGTESVNLALRGVIAAAGRPAPRLVTTEVEHPAVLETAAALSKQGARVHRLPVDAGGLPDPEDLRRSLVEETDLVSTMAANNETGALLPVRELAAVCRERSVPLHTDAVQAVGRVPVDVRDLGVDLLSATAHKIGGPPGVGFLYVRDGVTVRPTLAGGAQERGLRPGTTPVVLAVGFARALELAVAGLAEEAARQRGLLRDLLGDLEGMIPGLRVNGPPEDRLPNTLNLLLPGVPADALLIALDREGLCVGTGSACASGAPLPSHALRAMGLSAEEAACSIRISIGRPTSASDLARLGALLPPLARRIGGRA